MGRIVIGTGCGVAIAGLILLCVYLQRMPSKIDPPAVFLYGDDAGNQERMDDYRNRLRDAQLHSSEFATAMGGLAMMVVGSVVGWLGTIEKTNPLPVTATAPARDGSAREASQKEGQGP